MKLKEALSKVKEGQYIAHNNNWSEYSQQLFIYKGKLHWTAGLTVGGECCAESLASLKLQSDHEGFEIYEKWKGIMSKLS